jgi:RHS repeat-associated protein
MEQVNKKLSEQVPPVTPTGNLLYRNSVGDKQYELANHLGNVLNVVSDRKLPFDSNANLIVDYSIADVKTFSDYYPYGMQLPYRKGGDGESYRYGFQNQERDDEIKGAGNSVNFEYRMHDPRLGRFFAIDLLSDKYPWNSPYAFSENMVIHMIELEGLEATNIGGQNMGGSAQTDSVPYPKNERVKSLKH